MSYSIYQLPIPDRPNWRQHVTYIFLPKKYSPHPDGQRRLSRGCRFHRGGQFDQRKYKTLPLNEQTKSILEKVQYDNAVSALLGAVATKIGAKLGDDQERKSRLCACVHQAQDVHQYAECLVPFVEKKRIRSKRGTSVVESTFNWLAWLAEKVNSVLFSKFASSATSRNDQSMGIGKSSRREQSTRWSEWYWSNFWYKITTTTTTSDDDWLPEWPIPDWLREMTKDVHQLIKEMKQQQQEAWPEYRILSPRLFPWEERSSKSVNLLSPDVFSLSDNYDNDTDQSVSVGKLIDRLNLKERLALLGLVEQVDRLVDQYHQRQQQWRDLKSSQEKTVTKLIDTFTRLEQSYTEEQTRSIQTRGYAFLSEHQLRIIYDDGKLPVDIDTYRTMTVDEKNEALEYQLLQNHGRRDHRPVAVYRLADGRFGVCVGTCGLVAGIFQPNCPVVDNTVADHTVAGIFHRPRVDADRRFTVGIVASNFEPIRSESNLRVADHSQPPDLGPSILTPLVSSPVVDTVSMLSFNVLSPIADSPSIRSNQFMVATILSPGIRSPTINSTCYGCLIVASPCFMC
ncbi:Intracellular protein [Trichinella spiralis]|uniref:Intracellular protein n=1 Tax=Trichinella spiralis TaxID=6334 RepID=A0ABR3KVH0_TRISP